MNKYSMIISTCENKEFAKAIAKLLVEKRLASCVQMMPVESVYIWKGDICNDSEVALLIKTRVGLFNEIVTLIRENHSYEVPEIIQFPITAGLPEYLKWMDENTKEPENEV